MDKLKQYGEIISRVLEKHSHGSLYSYGGPYSHGDF